MNTNLNQALSLVDRYLAQFATSPNFWADFELAFGKNFDRLTAEQIRQSLSAGIFNRSIQVVQDQVLGLASGAFAAMTNTVYLRESLVASGDLEHISEVIIEEYGHSIDSLVNKEETPGDEGAIFRLLVKGVKLTQAMLAELRAEDDWAVISINGQQLAVEMAVFNGTTGNDTLGGLIANDNIGDDIFNPLIGVDVINGGEGTDTLVVDYTSSFSDDNTGLSEPFSNIVGSGEFYNGSGNQVTFTNIEKFNIAGTQYDDSIIGNFGDHTLNGGDGNDYLFVRNGLNIINGGAGDDYIRANNGSHIDGGEGADSLQLIYSEGTIANITLDTATSGTDADGTTIQNIDYFEFSCGSGNNYVDASAASQRVSFNIVGGGYFVGGSSNDSFVGSNSHFVGNAGNDSFLINVTGANNTLEGGMGDDQYYISDYIDIGGGNIINDSSGNDTLISSIGLDSGFSKSGNNLIIDISQDGQFNTPNDLTVIDFFSNTGSAGNGFIEKFTTRSGTSFFSGAAILNKFKPVHNDFNNDRKSDILLRNTDGHIGLWKMNGSIILSTDVIAPWFSDNTWQIVSTNDFNGDNKSDIFWRNTDGHVGLWKMDGATILSTEVIAPWFSDNSWKISGTGDFNGDGKSDILWRNTDGHVGLWTMDGSTILSTEIIAPLFSDNTWKIAGTGDFNGDSKSDILWRNDNNVLGVWNMDGKNIIDNKPFFNYRGPEWKIEGIDDFNREGTSDVLMANNNGTLSILNVGDIVDSFILDQQVIGTGDFNGDSKPEILWRNTNGSVSSWGLDGANVFAKNMIATGVDNTWLIAAPNI
jgi:hypothetical protein